MFIWSINQPWQQKQSSTRLILTDVYQTYYKDIVDLYWTFHVVFFLETDINIYFLNLAVQKWKTKKCIHTIKIRYILFYIKFDVWKRLLKMIIYIFIFIRMKKPVLWIKTRYVLFWQNWIFTKAKEIQWLERKTIFCILLTFDCFFFLFQNYFQDLHSVSGFWAMIGLLKTTRYEWEFLTCEILKTTFFSSTNQMQFNKSRTTIYTFCTRTRILKFFKSELLSFSF